VIPNWNGRRWLSQCLDALARQQLAPAELIVIDNGSDDGSVQYLREAHPSVSVVELGTNTGFAHAANRGLEAAGGELVALVNTDVVLAPDWLDRMSRALLAEPRAGAVACKMLSLADPSVIYDAGDILRRDGACEQRGRFMPDDGRWDLPGEVFGACAGAALYRRSAVLELGGFDERYFAYLEDVDLALRLRLAGWRCRYEPAVALHAGEGSSGRLRGAHQFLVVRNTVVLVAKSFPVRLPPTGMGLARAARTPTGRPPAGPGGGDPAAAGGVARAPEVAHARPGADRGRGAPAAVPWSPRGRPSRPDAVSGPLVTLSACCRSSISDR